MPVKEVPPVVIIGILTVFVALVVIGFVRGLAPHEKVIPNTSTPQDLQAAIQKAAQQHQAQGGQTTTAPRPAAP